MLSRRFGIIEVKSTLGEYTWQEVEPYLDRALELSGRERRSMSRSSGRIVPASR